jgi:hypothetical protein
MLIFAALSECYDQFGRGPISVLNHRWVTTRGMGEDAPYLPFAVPVSIGSVGWEAAIRSAAMLAAVRQKLHPIG